GGREAAAPQKGDLPPLTPRDVALMRPVLGIGRGGLKQPSAARPHKRPSPEPSLLAARALDELPGEDAVLEGLAAGLRRLAAGRPADLAALEALAAAGAAAAPGCLRTARALQRRLSPAGPAAAPAAAGAAGAEGGGAEAAGPRPTLGDDAT
ncbi:unnamed protein product, partial [Prorocentrum cordatum]